MFRHWTASLAISPRWQSGSAAAAEKQYGPGVTDKEIKIGQTSAYSGPASAYGTLLSKTQVAYIRMINEHGGINGRRIALISLRRRLQPTQDGRADPQACRTGARIREIGSLGTAPMPQSKILNEQTCAALCYFGRAQIQ